MTGIEDRATGSPDVSLARDAHGAYRLEDTDLVSADEVTAEDEFPKFGKFIEVEQLTRTGKDNGTAYVECPQGLAAGLVENDIGEGDSFTVRNAAKDVDGNWTFQVAPGTPADD